MCSSWVARELLVEVAIHHERLRHRGAYASSSRNRRWARPVAVRPPRTRATGLTYDSSLVIHVRTRSHTALSGAELR